MLDTPVYFFSRLVLAALVGARREVDERQVHIGLQDLRRTETISSKAE